MPFRLHPGVSAALAAALLFGLGAPLAKPLLGTLSPWLLAGLLYLGSGLGLWLLRRWQRAPRVVLPRGDVGWLLGAIVCGGMVGPALLMFGLSQLSAASVSLLLNLEGVLTALLAWFVFKENFDRRIAWGMLAIALGGCVLAWPGSGALSLHALWPTLAVLGACLAWAVDNNLTRKVALNDAGFIAMSKGLVAGATNLALALLLGATWPPLHLVLGAGLLGFASYGASLVLFVLALRQLGAARTGAYFSTAPFVGAAVALLLLGEPLSWQLGVAGLLMAVGVALHLTERHEHEHAHEPMAHTHSHVHGDGDPHHEHEHLPEDPPVQAGKAHRHWHAHAALTHSHAHYPDAHHRHTH